jgi:hypothetical protein
MNMDLKNQWPIMGFEEHWLLDSRCCPDIIDVHFSSMFWGLTVLHTDTALAAFQSAVWSCEAVMFGSLVEVGVSPGVEVTCDRLLSLVMISVKRMMGKGVDVVCEDDIVWERCWAALVDEVLRPL